MSWLEKIVPSVVRQDQKKRSNVPEGLWLKCPSCDAAIYRPELDNNHDVCPKCGYHMRISARRRLDLFLDPEDRVELGTQFEPEDRLKFKDSKRYKDRLSAAQKGTGEKDALVAIKGTVLGVPIVASSFEFNFMGGSMGSVVGARFVAAAEQSLNDRIPLICFSTSGGARMQEALLSLMQMAKTSAAIQKLRDAGIPYISVLTDPVYGGVSASLAMLGDLIIAEPKALIGFAGPRVIEQTVREKLPEGFQRSEFLLEHGAIDMIVVRSQMRETTARILAKLVPELTPREGEVEEAQNLETNPELESESTSASEPDSNS